jgi:hypothetical protein
MVDASTEGIFRLLKEGGASKRCTPDMVRSRAFLHKRTVAQVPKSDTSPTFRVPDDSKLLFRQSIKGITLPFSEPISLFPWEIHRLSMSIWTGPSRCHLTASSIILFECSQVVTISVVWRWLEMVPCVVFFVLHNGAKCYSCHSTRALGEAYPGLCAHLFLGGAAF